MKKCFPVLVILILLITVPSNAQFNISGGLGIDLTNTSSLNDYLSVNNGERRPDFNTNAEFYSEIGYLIEEDLQIGAEYAYSISSYSSSNFGYYDLTYNGHMPSVLAYYVISGQGYKFKFGGGAGYRYISLDEARALYPAPVNYTASGFGFVLRANGNTSLGGNLYADLSVHMRLDYVGEPKSSNNVLRNISANQNVNLNSFAVGLRLGVSYYFWIR